MTLTTLNPWQMLLWVVCLMILGVPILVAGVSAIINSWYSARERHITKLIKFFAAVAEKFCDELTKTKE